MNTKTTTSAYRPAYSPAEEDYLRANYRTATPAEIMAAVPRRKWQSIRMKATHLGVSGRPLGTSASGTSPWNDANRATLRELYPRPGGVVLVMAATGLGRFAVQGCAARMGVKCGPRIQHPRVVLPRPARVAAVKLAVVKVPRPVPVAKVAAPKRVRVRPSTPKTGSAPKSATPNANAARAAKKAADVKPLITAEQVRKMSYNDPQRVAYTLGGIAGWTQYMKAQA